MAAPAIPGAVQWPRLQAMLHTLHPGDVAVVDRGDRMETLLGSCVAIVMTDPRRTVGAMCHIVHSRPPVGDAVETGVYAAGALRTMYAGLLARGITPSLCEAWVFGGGNMFPSLFAQRHVGDDNANWALDALARDGVRVIAHDVGGPVYRRLGWTVGTDAPDVVAVPV
jgi:chemotaxis protein CheD